MTLFPLFLVILSGIFHATWNYFTKRSRNKLVFLWLCLVFDVVFYIPAFLIFFSTITGLGFLCALIAGILQAGYLILLAKAYEVEDFSIAYPFLRGIIPIGILLLAVSFLREHVSAIGLLGIFTVCFGVYFIHLKPGLSEGFGGPLKSFRGKTALLILSLGFISAVYHIFDKIGVGIVNFLCYYFLISLINCFVLMLFMLATTGSVIWRNIKQEWLINKKIIAVAGMSGVIAYPLVLAAMRLSQVSYVGAVRNVGIIFGVLMGVYGLKEKYGVIRIIASIVIAAGVILIGLG